MKGRPQIGQLVDKKSIIFFPRDGAFRYAHDTSDVIGLWSHGNSWRAGYHVVSWFQLLLTVHLRPAEDTYLGVDPCIAVMRNVTVDAAPGAITSTSTGST